MLSTRFLLVALMALPSVSALKWDCWEHIKCDMVKGALYRSNGCLCDAADGGGDDCSNVYNDGMPCFQSDSYEGCFKKGALGASPWGDTNDIGQGQANSKCWMNKADCWTDCECGINSYGVDPSDRSDVFDPSATMGQWIGGEWLNGVEVCFYKGGHSACIWGHCTWNGLVYESTHVPEGGGTELPFTVDHVCEVAPVQDCGSPGGEGDPHFKTWHGEWFDYHGACDLKMLDAPLFDGEHDLTIDIRTTTQYDYSYIEAAAIKIGNDVLEVGSFGDWAINGVDTPTIGGHGGLLMQYPIVVNEVNKKKNTYDIILSPNANITVSSYKNLVSVRMSVTDQQDNYRFFERSHGLMGSFHGALLGRDGVTMFEDMNEFGQEWQVTDQEEMLFRTARAPQYPAKCQMPHKSASAQRRLGAAIAEEAAEKACAHKTGKAFSNCVYDVMVTGDLDMATAGAM